MTVLSVSSVSHAFLGREVLTDISLDVEKNEVLALVGPSGCGKSTLAHVAAGLITSREGRVARKYARHGMVFQEPRLMPWATALENVAYAGRLSGLSRKDARDAAVESAEHVGFLTDDLSKFPVELSGGMRQRIAIARALVVAPDFIYFDEPFTALDVALKRRMQDLVIEASASERFGAIFVTHDLNEAARVAHRIAVMHPLGKGIIGVRDIAGSPGSRSEVEVFSMTQHWEKGDPLFRHVHDVDERRIA